MTFHARLAELLEKATKGPWVADNNEGFSQWKIWGGMSPSGNGAAGPRILDVIGDSAEADANAELIAYLVNHAEAIRDLVVAADAVIARWDTPTWKDAEPTAHTINAMREALAKLEEA